MSEQQRCDVCKLPADNLRTSKLFGNNDAICFQCFICWYDEGITDREEMALKSRLNRYKAERDGSPMSIS